MILTLSGLAPNVRARRRLASAIVRRSSDGGAWAVSGLSSGPMVSDSGTRAIGGCLSPAPAPTKDAGVCTSS